MRTLVNQTTKKNLFLLPLAFLLLTSLSLSGCGDSLGAECSKVCDLRDATGCSDIELSTCYNLCQAYQSAPEPCGINTEILSACLAEQAWVCTDFGPNLESPLACQEEQAAQDAACVFTEDEESTESD